MPIYKYSCEKCGLNVEVMRPVSERDNLELIRLKFCSELKNDSDDKVLSSCKLKREVTAGSFKI